MDAQSLPVLLPEDDKNGNTTQMLSTLTFYTLYILTVHL